MEDIRTQYVDDDNREMRIKHWEARLSDALYSVSIAQKNLEDLYRQRYTQATLDLGHTAMSEHLSEQKEDAA